jgi:hypothetical protein
MTSHVTPATPVSYAAEVIADDTGRWTGNQMRFPTEVEAMAYATALSWRWIAVREWRAVPSTDPVTHAIINGQVMRVTPAATTPLPEGIKP